MPHIIAHRVNSLDALRAAVQHKVAGIEFDVQLTADNLPILWHDKFLPGGKQVVESTWKEIQGLHKADGSALGLITLEALLAESIKLQISKSFQFFAELKNEAHDLPHCTLDVFQKHHLLDQSIMLTFIPAHIRVVEGLRDKSINYQKVKTGLNIERTCDKNHNTFGSAVVVDMLPSYQDIYAQHHIKPDIISIHYGLFDTGRVEALRAAHPGLVMASWTVNDSKALSGLTGPGGIDCVMTDNVLNIRAAL